MLSRSSEESMPNLTCCSRVEVTVLAGRQQPIDRSAHSDTRRSADKRVDSALDSESGIRKQFSGNLWPVL